MSKSKRIGVAESAARGTDGRHDRYAVHAINADGTLYVEYVGYRIGTCVWGLPLGGPGWHAQVPFSTAPEGFETVQMFESDSH